MGSTGDYFNSVTEIGRELDYMMAYTYYANKYNVDKDDIIKQLKKLRRKLKNTLEAYREHIGEIMKNTIFKERKILAKWIEVIEGQKEYEDFVVEKTENELKRCRLTRSDEWVEKIRQEVLQESQAKLDEAKEEEVGEDVEYEVEIPSFGSDQEAEDFLKEFKGE